MAKSSLYKRVAAFVGSPKFFWGVVGLLVVQAVWIALSGRYPMAYDENFHLGIIKLYAHHISPFWSGYPPDSGAFGAVARDPSYLYQWLMSFPYRLISALTSDQTAQVLILRFINIGLFAGSLPIYRRLLLRAGASRAAAHACLAFFILLPISPFLAAQINYDNLFVLVTPLSLLLALDFSRQLRRGRFDGAKLVLLAVLILLSSLVKYAFLPIAAALAAFVVIRLWKTYADFTALRKGLKQAYGAIPVLNRWILAVLLIISLGLFVERYGVNMVKYHRPAPACDQVLTADQCSAYGPWLRDYHYVHNKDPNATSSPLVFSADWFYGMWFRTYFAVDGPTTGFQTRGPLVMPSVGAIVFGAVSLIAALVCFKRLLKRYDATVLLLLLAATAFYLAALWLDEYSAFLRTSQPVAINGRYLLPIMPLLLVWLVLGMRELLEKRPQLQMSLAGVAVICALWGGGAMTYVLRSSPAWYWPGMKFMHSANDSLQRTLGPVTPGYRHPKAFMGHHGT
jgi:hypothetical protein